MKYKVGDILKPKDSYWGAGLTFQIVEINYEDRSVIVKWEDWREMPRTWTYRIEELDKCKIVNRKEKRVIKPYKVVEFLESLKQGV